MAEPFSKYLIRNLKDSARRDVRDYIIGMIPETARKIVGWILLIFGVVAMLGGWYVALFFGHPEMGALIFIFGMFSFAWGFIFLRHKG